MVSVPPLQLIVFSTENCPRFDPASAQWRGQSKVNKHFQAVSSAPAGSLLLGTQTWQIYNDTCGSQYSRNMTMTTCNDDQFTCQDGSCISMKERCDSKIQCEDGSDEKACTMVSLNPGYSKVVVPVGPDGLLHITMDILIRNNTLSLFLVVLNRIK